MKIFFAKIILFSFLLFAIICFGSSYASGKKIIVIDPGHGGKDNGATGPTGLKEKTVTLDIALILKKELEKTKKYKVYLTRHTDVFVSLKKRKKIAKYYKPDIFISIHCDGNKSRKAHGSTVYILSEKGKRYTIHRALTQGDYVFNGKEEPHSLYKANHIMASTMKKSEKLAKITIKNLTKTLGTKSLGVRRAAFKMLKVLDTPSILVEVAFITNWWEEKQLKKKSFRRKAAIAIKRSIEEFFKYEKN